MGRAGIVGVLGQGTDLGLPKDTGAQVTVARESLHQLVAAPCLVFRFRHLRSTVALLKERDKERKNRGSKREEAEKQRKTKIAPFVNARRTAIWLTMRGWAIVMAIDTGVC